MSDCTTCYCPCCHRSYRTKSNRKRHITKTFSCEDFLEESTCNKCHKYCNSPDGLVTHFDEEHSQPSEHNESSSPIPTIPLFLFPQFYFGNESTRDVFPNVKPPIPVVKGKKILEPAPAHINVSSSPAIEESSKVSPQQSIRGSIYQQPNYNDMDYAGYYSDSS